MNENSEISMRLDTALVKRKITKSRTLACVLIKEGKIDVNGLTVMKPSFKINPFDTITLVGELPKYVSRGGLKLEYALKNFNINVKNCICLDVGASTGGFTDCLLNHGARLVYAVDVGKLQLSPQLQNDERVISLEQLDIRKASKIITDKVSFICVDVSFISLTQIIPFLNSFYDDNVDLDIVLLVKPQFEVGQKFLGKKGIVKDEKAIFNAIKKITDFAVQNGYCVLNQVPSPIKGGDGNREFLLYLKPASQIH